MTPHEPEEARFRQTGWPALRAKLFHKFFLFSRPMTLGVRAMIHDRSANTVFLIRHTYVPGWHFPGGGVEAGESMLQSLARECAEEANIVFTKPPVLRSIHFNQAASRRDHIGFYVVDAFMQEKQKVPDREIAEAGFFTIDALPEGTTRATRLRIVEVMGGLAASPYW